MTAHAKLDEEQEIRALVATCLAASKTGDVDRCQSARAGPAG